MEATKNKIQLKNINDECLCVKMAEHIMNEICDELNEYNVSGSYHAKLLTKLYNNCEYTSFGEQIKLCVAGICERTFNDKQMQKFVNEDISYVVRKFIYTQIFAFTLNNKNDIFVDNSNKDAVFKGCLECIASCAKLIVENYYTVGDINKSAKVEEYMEM